jgi:hypothetical protein
MAKPTAAKRAKKPTKQRSTTAPRAAKKPRGIVIQLDDGPMAWPVPFDRGDLEQGCEQIELSYHWDTLVYRLDHIDEAKVHHYRWGSDGHPRVQDGGL